MVIDATSLQMQTLPKGIFRLEGTLMIAVQLTGAIHSFLGSLLPPTTVHQNNEK